MSKKYFLNQKYLPQNIIFESLLFLYTIDKKIKELIKNIKFNELKLRENKIKAFKVSTIKVIKLFESHPVFTSPKSNAKIWRYIDFSKFVNMLDRNALFFARASELDDPYEGIMPKFNDKIRSSIYQDARHTFKSDEQYQNFLIHQSSLNVFYKNFKKTILINSWHLNDHESASMWKLYSHDNYGIAIQSTFSKLCNSLKNNIFDQIFIGEVKYLDYEKEWLEEGNLFYPFITKRKSFVAESELRAIEWSTPSNSFITKDKSIIYRNETTKSGKYVPVNLDILIDKIFVSPLSESWVHSTVEAMIKKYNLNKNVTQSDLYLLK